MSTPQGGSARLSSAALARADRLLAPGRVRFYAGLLAGIAIAYWAAIIIGGHAPFDATGNPMGMDFIAKAAGGRIAVQGRWHDLYKPESQHLAEVQLLGNRPFGLDIFIAPPIAAFLFAPFAALPYLLGAALWTVCSSALVAASLWLIWPLLPRVRRQGAGIVSLLLFSSFPVVELLIYGQDAAVSLFLLALGLRLLLARRDAAAGAMLALGIFKPQYVLLIPVLFLLQRRWRALYAWLAVAAALTAISLFLIGPGGVRNYLQLLSGEFNHDGVTLGRVWDTPSLFGLARVLRAVLPRPLTSITTVAVIAGGGLLLFRWAQAALASPRTRREFASLYAGTVLVTALLNPHLFYYDAVILLLPLLVLYDVAGDKPVARLLLAAAYLMSWSYIVFAQPLFTQLPGPLPIVSAPWVVVPLIGLFAVCCRTLVTGKRLPAAAPGRVAHPGPEAKGDGSLSW